MFDDVYEMAGYCTEMFRDGVRDSFGHSIVSEVLGPIQNEIGMLRRLHDEYQRQSIHIQQLLVEAKALVFDEGCQP